MATEREETGREETPREERSHFLQLLAIGLIASIIGIAVGLLIDWWPAQGSAEASQVDTLYDVLIIFSVPMFVLVVTVVLYCAWRYRMKPGEEELDGPPIHGNTRLEIIWTAIPAIILVALCSYSFAVLTDIEDADARALNVRVVGEQFTWTFYYRDGSGKEIASPQLYVPRGQQVNFTVQSQDVIHDFWVPAFRVKIDAVPGINTHLRVTPDRVGDYPVICAELCGLGHSVMRQTAHVMPSRPTSSAGWTTAARPTSRPRPSRTPTPAPAAARPTARRSSPRTAAARATRSPTRGRPAAPARTSTTSSPTRTRPSSRRASRTRAPRSRRASRTGSCRRTSARRSSRRNWTRW